MKVVDVVWDLQFKFYPNWTAFSGENDYLNAYYCNQEF